jgi:hypothetical protein
VEEATELRKVGFGSTGVEYDSFKLKQEDGKKPQRTKYLFSFFLK